MLGTKTLKLEEVLLHPHFTEDEMKAQHGERFHSYSVHVWSLA